MKKTQNKTKVEKVVVKPTTNKTVPALDKKAKFAKTGFILGIVAICASIFMIGGLVGVPGIVFSALGRKSQHPKAKKWSKVGMILSIFGIAIGVTLLVLFEAVFLNLIYQQGGHPIGG